MHPVIGKLNASDSHRDLLQKDQTKRLDLKESPDAGVYVKDLSSFVCKSVKEIEHVMTVGNKNRAIGYAGFILRKSTGCHEVSP